jgi:hypothetical protein
MTRLELLTEKRFELVNKLIELKTWQMSNPQAKTDEAINQIQTELNELEEKLKRLRMDK